VSKDLKVFIKNVKSLMEGAGWTQVELAKRTKIARPNLSNVLTGKNSPSLDTLSSIAEAFGVTIAALFATDEKPEPKVHVERTTLPDEIRSAIQTENSKLMNELIQKLGPVLSSLQRDHGVSELVVKKAPKDKLEGFVNRLLRAPGVSADFYRLLDEGTEDGTLRVEFLRSLLEGVLAAGGPEAAELRKVLKTLLR
jgi:transcriptional regulator with XRE-family HTH domain